MIHTSQTDPLRIDAVAVTPGGGRIGMTLCPGKKQAHGASGAWDRDLDTDLDAIAAFGCRALVTLMEPVELERYGVPAPLLKHQARQRGIDWYLLPIRDVSIPAPAFEPQWRYVGLRLRHLLQAGSDIVLHCRGGLGRTGTIAARLLIELGWQPDQALAAVRKARPGAVETPEQEQYVLVCHAEPVVEQGPLLDAQQQAQSMLTRHAEQAADHGPSVEERRLACLLGGAVGDAFGYAVEFKKLARIQAEYGELGLREPLRQAGRLIVSDDTQMTLFTVEGLLRGLTAETDLGPDTLVGHIRLAYLDWLHTQGYSAPHHAPVGELWKEPAFGFQRAPGHTCISALEQGGHGTPRNRINDSKGCGGVMRVAPIGLCTLLDAETVFELAERAAAITHTHITGYLAAGALAVVIRELQDGTDLPDAIDTALRRVSREEGCEETTRAIRQAVTLAKSARQATDAIRLLGEGWIAEEALAIGLYAALTGDDFPEVFAIAANHDGDSDSTASIAGQIYGAWKGVETLPDDWVSDLDVRKPLLNLAADWHAADQAG